MTHLIISPNGPVFDLPSLVALEHGFYAHEGISVQRTHVDPWLPVGEQVLERDKERAFEQAPAGVYNACKWGVVKRSADSQRRGKILDLPRYLHHLLDEVPGGLTLSALHVERLRYVDSGPHRQDEFLPAYRGMVDWGRLQDGVVDEDVVDTRIAAFA